MKFFLDLLIMCRRNMDGKYPLLSRSLHTCRIVSLGNINKISPGNNVGVIIDYHTEAMKSLYNLMEADVQRKIINKCHSR